MQGGQQMSRRRFLGAAGAGGATGVLGAVLYRQRQNATMLVRDTAPSSPPSAAASRAPNPAPPHDPAVAVSSEPAIAPSSRPNIVLILADDMGWSDIGCFGSEIATPNLDRLAAEGTRFTGFTNNARCCPSRASILTGLYPTQTGVGYMDTDQWTPQYQGHLNKSCVTLGEVLRSSGYRTGLFGKWHVGDWGNGVTPAARGFERSYGPAKRASYFRPVLYRDEKIIGVPTAADYYLTDAITDEAIAGIGEFVRSGTPFLAHVTYTAPHPPLHARENDIAAYRGRYFAGWDALREERFARQQRMGLVPDISTLPPRDSSAPAWRHVKHREWQAERMAVYAAQVTAMDRGIGRLLNTLDRLGVRENTIVMFLSDNGASAENLSARNGVGNISVDGRPMRSGNSTSITPGPSDTFMSYGLQWANASNTPFIKFKHWTHEGGVATPFIASWPGQTRPGRIDRSLLHVMDLMPTLVELAGTTYPETHGRLRVSPLEGRSFAPLLHGPPSTEWTDSRRLFWEHEGNRAVRHGRWKLVAPFGLPWELYDMETDRAEQHNLAAERGDLVQRFTREWREWATRVGVRRWRPDRRYRP